METGLGVKENLVHQKTRSALEKQLAVNILASKKDGTLYVGVTSDLLKTVW